MSGRGGGGGGGGGHLGGVPVEDTVLFPKFTLPLPVTFNEPEEGREERGRRAICASGVKKEEVDEHENKATMMISYKREMNGGVACLCFWIGNCACGEGVVGGGGGDWPPSESFHQATNRQETSGHADMFGNTLPN